MTIDVANAVPRFQIFPAIGLARVGDSRLYTYIASESPQIDHIPPGGYRGPPEPPILSATLQASALLVRDGVISADDEKVLIHDDPGHDGEDDPQIPDDPNDPGGPGGPGLPTPADLAVRRLKRMGCRFRIYEFDAGGNPLREITLADGDIEWTVRLVNKKAAGVNDWGYNPAGASDLNTQTEDQLTIDTGDGVISGPNAGPVLMEGTFLVGLAEERQVKLGDLTTDRRGRLVVYGGHGVAESWESNPTSGPNLVRNAGWYDDTSDGIVEATVTIGEETFTAEAARIIVGPPDYAHPCTAPVTLFDLAFQRSGGWRTAPTTSFKSHIHPLLHRTVFLEWSLFALEGGKHGRTPKHGHGYTANHDMHPDADFFNAEIFRLLQIQNPLDPDITEAERLRERYLVMLKDPDDPTSDGGQGEDQSMPAIETHRFTATQYQYFVDFDANAFLSDWPEGRDPAELYQPHLRDVPVEDQPTLINRAAMDQACGGPFLPGFEIGAVSDDAASYTRFILQNEETAFRVSSTVEAGDLTQDLALPWQAGLNQHNYQPAGVLSADSLWPSARPVVVPAKRSGTSDDLTWTRPMTGQGNTDIFENQKMPGNQQMIDNWAKLGFLAPRRFYVEISRTLPEDPAWPN